MGDFFSKFIILHLTLIKSKLAIQYPNIILRASLLSLIFHFWCFVSQAQSYEFVKFGIEDGLAQSQITDIDQDSLGNIWYATQGGGVSKFNGLEFNNYTVKDGLASNYIRKVVCGSKGITWIATAEGISSVENGIITNHFRSDSVGSVNVLHEGEDGAIWFGSSVKGISKWVEGQSIVTYDKSNGFVDDRVIDIKQGKAGEVWIVTVLNGLFKYENGVFQKIVGVDQLKGYILSIAIGHDKMWLGTNKGVFTLDLTSTNYELQNIEPLEGIFVRSILVRGDEVWVIPIIGLMKYSNDEVKTFSGDNGFTDFPIYSGFTDREGNLWLGTNGDGVYRFFDEKVAKFDEENGLPHNDILSITQDLNHIYWIATNGKGLVKYDSSGFYNFTTENGLTSNYVTSVVTDADGVLWLGTRGNGLMKYFDGKFISYTQNDGLIHNTIRSLYCDEENTIWVMTINGVSKLKNNEFTNYTTKNGLLDDVVWNVLEQGGRKLLVTRNGISAFEGDSLFVYDNTTEIFDKRINVIVPIKDSVYWIGYSGHGIVRYDKKTGSVQHITSDDGLVSDIIHSITILDEHEILAGTERGISEVLLNPNGSVRIIRNIGSTKKGHGLATTNTGAVFVDRDKMVWYGTKNGIFTFHEERELNIRVEPIIHIIGADILFDSVNVIDDLKLKNEKELTLSYNENSIAIAFFGTHISNPTGVRYKYILENFQSSWSDITNKTEATYTNLPPGKYNFLVRAQSSEGVWSSLPAKLRIVVRPPFYLTPWFFVLSIISIGLLIRYIYLLRVKVKIKRALAVQQIREDEASRVRKTMARDFHDNMGNQLASITVFTNLINLKLKNKSKEIDSLLQNIEKHSKSLYTGTKDFIWSMDPESDNLLEIFTYLKDFGEDLFDHTTIRFYSNADDLGDKLLIVPSGWSRQIVLIFKEAMTNALKYSGATELNFSFELDRSHFVITCTDNGSGFDEEKAKMGNGVRNMKDRASKINSQLEISNTGTGTKVALTGDLKNIINA